MSSSGASSHEVLAAPTAGELAAARGSLVDHLLGKRPRLVLATAVAGALALLLFACWAYQIRNGLGVSGLNRPVFWGFYIITFVFWIGISHAGTLISAILRVTGAGWRRPVTRCAEGVTVFALCVGGLFPLIHLGRPWVFFYMLPYANDRMLWPNFRSPLIWDLVAITTYLIGSLLYLSLPLLPDLAVVRDRLAQPSGLRQPGLRHWIFCKLSLGWQGRPSQWHALEQGIKVMAVAIIPVAVSVHSIVSWDFAMTQVPGWKSSIFGPYFVVGAIYSGIAVLLIAMALLRSGLRLQSVLHDTLFNNLGLLFLAMTMLWGYFTFAEHLTTWYAGDRFEQVVHHELMRGTSLHLLVLMVAVNVVIPLAVLPFRWGRRPLALALVSCGVVLGMWLERWLIVVPSLSVPRSAFLQGSYSPSWVEIGVLVGSVGLFAFLYLVFMQILPIVSVWEIREGIFEHEAKRIKLGRSAVGVQSQSQSQSQEQDDAVENLGASADPTNLRLATPPGPKEHVCRVAVDNVTELFRLNDRARDAQVRLVDVRSSAPVPGLQPAKSTAQRRPVVLIAALMGAFAGGLSAFLLATRTATAYPLPTGGMEIVAGPPVAIVTFEGTALGLMLATALAVVVAVRKGRAKSGLLGGALQPEEAAQYAEGALLVDLAAESQDLLELVAKEITGSSDAAQRTVG